MSLHIMKTKIDSFDGDFAFLSNFYESEIVYEGTLYPTVEHAFQAAKSLDPAIRYAISKAATPGVAKKMGRQVELRSDWESIKNTVMYDCVMAKFQNPILRAKLLATYPRDLVEGNTWHDNCWGNCSCEKCRNKSGENRLGRILMKVREELMSKSNKILVVVDMQNDFVTGALGSAEARSIVPSVVNKVRDRLNEGYAVIFTADTHYENYLDTQEGHYLPVPHCIHNTNGWEVIPELKPYVFDYRECGVGNLYRKPVFGSIQLAEFLSEQSAVCAENGANLTVEFVGVCTDICVVSNCLLTKAYCPDATVFVDASCCAGVTPEKHKAALETMRSCQLEVVGE